MISMGKSICHIWVNICVLYGRRYLTLELLSEQSQSCQISFAIRDNGVFSVMFPNNVDIKFYFVGVI